LDTERLVNTGAGSFTGPQTDGNGEVAIYPGKKNKYWLVANLKARAGDVYDYETGLPLVAPASIEIYLTEAQQLQLKDVIEEGYTEGLIIQARSGDVAAFDIAPSGLVRSVLGAMNIIEDQLPLVLLIERRGSSLSYEQARTRRQGAELQGSGRGHYMTEEQLAMKNQGLFSTVGKAFTSFKSMITS
jgi:hypothetical protein